MTSRATFGVTLWAVPRFRRSEQFSSSPVDQLALQPNAALPASEVKHQNDTLPAQAEGLGHNMAAAKH